MHCFWPLHVDCSICLHCPGGRYKSFSFIEFDGFRYPKGAILSCLIFIRARDARSVSVGLPWCSLRACITRPLVRPSVFPSAPGGKNGPLLLRSAGWILNHPSLFRGWSVPWTGSIAGLNELVMWIKPFIRKRS